MNSCAIFTASVSEIILCPNGDAQPRAPPAIQMEAGRDRRVGCSKS